MRHGRTRRGQALVEFALILPILMILLMGIIEFGRAWNVKQVLTDASREGARLAVVAVMRRRGLRPRWKPGFARFLPMPG